MSTTQILEGENEGGGQILIGEGTFGKVYKVWENDRWYAVKRISKSLIQRYGRLQQLFRQIQILKRINHPNIVNFVSFDQSKNDYFELKMEYCKGQNLKQFLCSKQYRHGILPHNSRAFGTRICLDYIDALVQIRSQMVINRDIKSDNIMVEFSKNGEFMAKMIDFGQAKFNIKQAMTRVGTRGYMAPEIYEGGRAYTEACDCWSLGQTIYQIFQGVRSEHLQQKRFSSPFKQNFYPTQEVQFHEFYTKYIFQGICLNTKRTPAPFRDIIRGFLKPDPSDRITIRQMLQILINQFEYLCQDFGSEQQKQYQLNRLIDCLSKEKQTIYRKQQMSIIMTKIQQLYTKLYVPLTEITEGNRQQQHFQVIRLILRIIDRIYQNIAEIMLRMDIEEEYAFEQILKNVIDKDKYDAIVNCDNGYVNYYIRQHRIVIDRKLQPKDIGTEIMAFLKKHFGDRTDEILQLIRRLLSD